MALDWPQEQEDRIRALIVSYPPESHRCEALAARLILEARGSDAGARPIEVVPGPHGGRFVVPKYPLPRAWYRHVAARTRSHELDALTGAHGCESHQYLLEFWEYPDALVVRECELQELEDIEEDAA